MIIFHIFSIQMTLKSSQTEMSHLGAHPRKAGVLVSQILSDVHCSLHLTSFVWRIYSLVNGHIHFTSFDKKMIFWNLEVAHVGEGALLNHGHCVVEVSPTLVLFPIIRISVKRFVFFLCGYCVIMF